MKNNNKVIISLAGVFIMLLLIISATYAYFSVTITGNGSKTMITANTPKKHSLSVSTLYDDIHIHVDNNDMKLANVGSYYGAVNDNRYETNLTTGTHQIIEVSSKGMENIRYSCSGDIKVTLETKDGSMGSVLEKEDVLLYLKGLGLDEILDLSTLKINNTKIYTTTFDIDGNDSDYLSAIVELINKESYQNYIANKMLNVSIEAENMVCHENGTYKYMVALNKHVKEMQNGKETGKRVSLFYDDEGTYQKIQNIYLVDYIDTFKAIKTWELGDTERGTKLDEVMGWLEVTPNENDNYDLYIGADGPMRASKDMSSAFYNFTNLKKISGDALDTSEVTSVHDLFNNDINLTDISALESWDVSNVIDMYNLFYYCSNLSDITVLKNWNVSKVTNMSYIFESCKKLIDISALSNWNTKNVINMSGMFIRVTSLSDITSLSNWDVSKVIYMSGMFKSTLINDLTPLVRWNISNVENTHSMFNDCKNLTDLSPMANWVVSKVTDMSSMFSTTSISDITPLKDWDVSSVINMSGLFQSTLLKDLTPIKNWDIFEVKNMSVMFCDTPISNLTPLKDWDVSKVTDMSAMFDSTLINDLTPLSTWDVSHVTSMDTIFRFTQVSDLTPISGWDVSNVTNMRAMFRSNLISDLTPIKDWNVSKVTDMTKLFIDCKNLQKLDGLEKWDTKSVTKMGGMFTDCINLENIDAITNWNVSNVTQMGGNFSNGSGMFQNCINLTKVDLSNWNVPKLTDVSIMFAQCTKLFELKLPKGLYNNISDIKNYSGLFGGEYTASNGSKVNVSSVSPNITVYTEASQVDWVEARLQEALGENNHSAVLTYE